MCKPCWQKSAQIIINQKYLHRLPTLPSVAVRFSPPALQRRAVMMSEVIAAQSATEERWIRLPQENSSKCKYGCAWVATWNWIYTYTSAQSNTHTLTLTSGISMVCMCCCACALMHRCTAAICWQFVVRNVIVNQSNRALLQQALHMFVVIAVYLPFYLPLLHLVTCCAWRAASNRNLRNQFSADNKNKQTISVQVEKGEICRAAQN